MPLMRRRPLLRAAAVGGGAYMAGKHRANANADREQTAYAQGQAAAMAPPPPAPAAAPAPAAGVSADDVSRLQELGKLRDQGILTEEEFAQQKARILGTG